MCFLVQAIFRTWLNWTEEDFGVSWAHFEWYFCNGIAFFSFANFLKWIYHHDISAQLSMHNFTSMQSFYKSVFFYIFSLFYCLRSVTLVKVTDQNFYYKIRINIRAIQSIFCHYFYGNYTSNVNFNLYLFKKAIFDVM